MCIRDRLLLLLLLLLICNHSLFLITDAEVACRAASDHGPFEITCPHEDVIKINSAGIGFVSEWNDNTDSEDCESIQPTCPLLPEHLHRIITACNENSSCDFKPEVFNSETTCSSTGVFKINKVIYNCTVGK